MELEMTEQTLSQDRAKVLLNGRINAATSPALKAQLADLIQRGYCDLTLDMTQVRFIDSSGLAALVSGLKRARQAGGGLVLVGLNEETRAVFTLSKLDSVFEFGGYW